MRRHLGGRSRHRPTKGQTLRGRATSTGRSRRSQQRQVGSGRRARGANQHLGDQGRWVHLLSPPARSSWPRPRTPSSPSTSNATRSSASSIHPRTTSPAASPFATSTSRTTPAWWASSRCPIWFGWWEKTWVRALVVQRKKRCIRLQKYLLRNLPIKFVLLHICTNLQMPWFPSLVLFLGAHGMSSIDPAAVHATARGRCLTRRQKRASAHSFRCWVGGSE